MLNYSHNYYGIKKTLANLVKENSAKIGVKKISFTGEHNITYSNKYKESFFCKEGKKRQRRTRREILEETLDRELVRLATKLTKESKCQPLKRG